MRVHGEVARPGVLDDGAPVGDRGGPAVEVRAGPGAVLDPGFAGDVDGELRAVRAIIARGRAHDDRVRDLGLHEVVIRTGAFAVVRGRLLGRGDDCAALSTCRGCLLGALLAQPAHRGDALLASLALFVVTAPRIEDHLLNTDWDFAGADNGITRRRHRTEGPRSLAHGQQRVGVDKTVFLDRHRFE